MTSLITRSSSSSSPANSQLLAFLLGTLCSSPGCALPLLRGQQDLLRLIWTCACEELWQAHLHWYRPKTHRFRGPNMSHSVYPLQPHCVRDAQHVPDLSAAKEKLVREWQAPVDADLVYSGVPMAIVAKGVEFPVRSVGATETETETETALLQGAAGGAGLELAQPPGPLFVNMMPFDLNNPKGTLPSWLHGYIPMIEKCRELTIPLPDLVWYHEEDAEHEPYTAYLTIDERYVECDTSQRRGGVHVESPIWPVDAAKQWHIAPASLYWGGGPIRASRVQGGIFLGSNMNDTTAVWNCQVMDDNGSVIRKHGNLEHCRDLLGPPSKILEAGELIWLTDRTPHESLPAPVSGFRQFFRLVVGTVSAWLVDHSTMNPLGYQPGEEVVMIHGNKFDLCKSMPVRWECGTKETLQALQEFATLHSVLQEFELGHLIDVLKKLGIVNVQTLLDYNFDSYPGFWEPDDSANESEVEVLQYLQSKLKGEQPNL